MSDDLRSVLTESELLIEKLREDPILARLADYALKRGITLLVHPDSELMIMEKGFSWTFFNFLGEGGLFIFIPFDTQRKKIFPSSVAQQIVCFAHELGHFELRNSENSGAIKKCPLWLEEFASELKDKCLLKEILAYLEAVKILNKIGKIAIRSRGWRITLFYLWRQCPECLKEINRGGCFQKDLIVKALDRLAKTVKLCQEEIAQQIEKMRD